MAFTTRPLLNFTPYCEDRVRPPFVGAKRSARYHDGWDLDKGQDNRGHHTTKGEDPIHGHHMVKGEDPIRGHHITKGEDPIRGHNTMKGEDPIRGHHTTKGEDPIRGHHTAKGEDPIRGHHTAKDPSHWTVTSSARAARSVANLGTVHTLYWVGPVLTNYGSMAVRNGHTVTIRYTGTYLLSMRPDPKRNKDMNFAVVKNQTAVWRVYTEGTPVGDMAAFRFTTSTTLEYVIFQSDPCDFEDGSYISIALCQSDWEG